MKDSTWRTIIIHILNGKAIKYIGKRSQNNLSEEGNLEWRQVKGKRNDQGGKKREDLKRVRVRDEKMNAGREKEEYTKEWRYETGGEEEGGKQWM